MNQDDPPEWIGSKHIKESMKLAHTSYSIYPKDDNSYYY